MTDSAEEGDTGPGVATGSGEAIPEQGGAAYIGHQTIIQNFSFSSPRAVTEWVERLRDNKETADRVLDLVKEEQQLELKTERSRSRRALIAGLCIVAVSFTLIGAAVSLAVVTGDTLATLAAAVSTFIVGVVGLFRERGYSAILSAESKSRIARDKTSEIEAKRDGQA